MGDLFSAPMAAGIATLVEDEKLLEDAFRQTQIGGSNPNGVLEESVVRFADQRHIRGIIERIVSRIGRRIDDTQPLVDARLPDGSRVNAVIPPLAINSIPG